MWVMLGAGLRGASVVPKPRAAQRSERQGKGTFRAVGEPRAVSLEAFCGLRALPPGPGSALLSSRSVDLDLDLAVGGPWAPWVRGCLSPAPLGDV